MPALRGVAQVGLPGLQAQPWVDERRCACGFRQALREPLVRHFEAAQQRFSQLRSGPGARAPGGRVQEFAPNLAGRGTGSPRSGRGRPISPASSWPTRRRGPAAAGLRPRGGRGLEPAGRPGITRAPGRLVRAGPGLHRAETLAAGPGTWNGPILGGAGSLSPEPGHRRRPARRPGSD